MKKLMRIPKAFLGLGAIALAAIGARIGIPGVDTDVVRDFFIREGGGGLLAVYNWLVGGAISRGAILALGIMPYFSAVVAMRLAAVVSPRVAELEQRESGRRALRWWTRGATLGLSLVQSFGFSIFLQKIPGAVAVPGPGFTLRTVLTLTAGALSVMWLTERLSERGAAPTDDAADIATVGSDAVASVGLAPSPAQVGGAHVERLLTPGEIPVVTQPSRAKARVRVDEKR
jgi:preprotein translocase subunit SecY